VEQPSGLPCPHSWGNPSSQGLGEAVFLFGSGFAGLVIREAEPDASQNDALCIDLCYIESMTISLRNLPPEVEKAILETSHREGISLNKATLRLLQSSLHKPAINHDFDDFIGTWSDAEADEFNAALAEMRKVDPADWEPFE
jgi:hypothetical protein